MITARIIRTGFRWFAGVTAPMVLFTGVAVAQPNLATSDIKVTHEQTGQGGTRIIVDYELAGSGIAVATPAYIFFRYSTDDGATWHLVARHLLNGDHDLVYSAGQKNVWWWGAGELALQNLDNLQVRVRASQMIRVPGGTYTRMTAPGGGFARLTAEDTPDVPQYYVAKYEVPIALYVDYLNEVGQNGRGYNARMSSAARGGLIQEGEKGAFAYSPMEGKAHHPISYVSWYDAMDFTAWSGLRLLTEEEWEKAYRGGHFLDGDDNKREENPLPERKYPWGDEEPNADDIFRCNIKGDGDGWANTAPAGSFPDYNSPYGISDMAGNVIEWTFNWYETPYHADLDGYRMVRGGSWNSSATSYTAITGATQLPLNEDSLMGFRLAR